MSSVKLVTDERGFIKGIRIHCEKEDPVGIFMAEDYPLGNELALQCLSREVDDSGVELEFRLQDYHSDRIAGTWCLDLSGEAFNGTEDILNRIREKIESVKKVHRLLDQERKK